jgi:hypothetical protein
MEEAIPWQVSALWWMAVSILNKSSLGQSDVNADENVYAAVLYPPGEPNFGEIQANRDTSYSRVFIVNCLNSMVCCDATCT